MQTDILIIGAGVAGLAAARLLRDQGRQTLVVDKGRGVGGRVATRRLGDGQPPAGRWDHGAQFVTFRNAGLVARLRAWGAWESLEPWYGEAGRQRFRSSEGLNAIPRALAAGLDIRKQTRVTRLLRDGGAWRALTDTGDELRAAQVLCALPVPQALELFAPETLPASALALRDVRYHRCLTLLAELEGPSGLAAPGHLSPESGILRSLTDNQAKGISDAPTLTAHATPAFSLEWYERDRATAAAVLRAAAQEHIASRITATQIHGWKFAEAARRFPAPCLLAEPGLCFAGDGFQSDDNTALPPRIESALLSGLAAARALAP